MGDLRTSKVQNTDSYSTIAKQIRKLCLQLGICIVLMLGLAFAVVLVGFGGFGSKEYVSLPDDVYYLDYNVYNLSFSKKNERIKEGFEIFRNTAQHLGPRQTDPTNMYAGNNLACASCHLNGGTKPYAAPLIGVVKRFPQYRGREDKMGTIEERINGCMERSMNGRMMPKDSDKMKSLLAYLEWLGRATPSNGKIEGQGFLPVEIPDRAVDLEHGELVFQRNCVECHGADGQGASQEDGTYLYPPLWGDDSYNNGAGMTRVITAAQFIKGNMPYGTTFDSPVLTDEESYDVAGYINQKSRPTKPHREVDFPDLAKKPVSTPYGPYSDHFSEEQHQLGPFQPIMEYYKNEFDIVKSK
ncbi:c-type cytochrome [Flagellimonas oceanensis]|uniref:c-type cytochrome n=1 Tax=Flagellimonas oceanensis TaxID=2499163 RepID=UPI003BAC20B7